MKKYIFLIVMILLSGCASNRDYLFEKNPTIKNSTLIEKNKEAVYSLIRQTKDIEDKTIIVTTISNVNDLSKTSKIGRVITEQIITDLSKTGVKVVEIRMRKNDIIKVKPKSGEFILTRNALELARVKKADAVLVGTYTTYNNKLYVSMRLIDPTTNIIVASTDYTKNLPSKPHADPFSNFAKDN